MSVVKWLEATNHGTSAYGIIFHILAISISACCPFRPREYEAEKKVDGIGYIDRNVRYSWRLFLILLGYFFPVVQIKSFRSCQIFFDTLLNSFANIIDMSSLNLESIMILYFCLILFFYSQSILDFSNCLTEILGELFVAIAR
jgi:hypothetical protein